MKSKFFVLTLIFLISLCTYIFYIYQQAITTTAPAPRELAKEYLTQEPSLAPTPTPTPRPLTLSQLNELYGPCVKLPTLMYHHIADLDKSKSLGYSTLSVEPDTFRKQMQEIRDRGYEVITMQQLINFFELNQILPPKPILITFDDGYNDLHTEAKAILQEFNYPSTLFVSTGLMSNPGYLSWEQVNDLATTAGIFMANHTWSHKNMSNSLEVVEEEITIADRQLLEKNYGQPKIFAYPYGISSPNATQILSKLGYKLAFTTKPGTILCEKQRLLLPRIRIGNSSLSSYGL